MEFLLPKCHYWQPNLKLVFKVLFWRYVIDTWTQTRTLIKLRSRCFKRIDGMQSALKVIENYHFTSTHPNPQSANSWKRLEKCIVMSMIIFTSWKFFFFISVNWWSFTGVWVKASLLKSPGLFSVFWLISILMLFGLSPLVFLFSSPPVLVPIFCWQYQEHQLQLV